LAAYFPHAEGLTLSEGAALLKTILADPRVRLVEVSEYGPSVTSIGAGSAS
jgi:arginase family enzyme